MDENSDFGKGYIRLLVNEVRINKDKAVMT